MNDFVQINKDRFLRAFVKGFLLALLIFLIINIYNCYYKDYCASKIELLYSLLFYLLVAPLVTLISDVIPNFFEYRRMEKVLKTIPLKKLLKIGFKKDIANKNKKWSLAKVILAGRFDSYEMICELESGRLRIIAKSNYEHLDRWKNEEIKRIQNKFKNIRFEWDGLGIATSLKTSDVKQMTFYEFENYLHEFVKMLKELRIK